MLAHCRSSTSQPLSPPLSLHNGQDSTPSSSGATTYAQSEKRARTMAKDYPEYKKLLLAATRAYYVKIWTSNLFPDDKAQAEWAVQSWDAVSNGTPLPDNSMIQYVSNVPMHVAQMPANEH